jgi:AcrR family transcriptional regulator
MTSSPSGKRRLGRPPKDERGDTRQELLDAALSLFAKQGYAATTVRQIADIVGVRDSAIYGHFESKRELFDTLIQESGPGLIDELEVDFARLSEHHPSEALPDCFEQLVQAWDRPRPRMMISMLTREGLEGVAGVLDEVRDRFLDHFHRWADDGLMRDDISVEQLIWELITPLAAIRLLHLRAEASTAERKKGRELAQAHLAYFLITAAPDR